MFWSWYIKYNNSFIESITYYKITILKFNSGCSNIFHLKFIEIDFLRWSHNHKITFFNYCDKQGTQQWRREIHIIKGIRKFGNCKIILH